MHRSLTLFFTCAALLWSSTCFAAPGELGDAGGANSNPHNLSSRQTGTTPHATDMPGTEIDTQICIFCHTPHGATPKSTLWNRPNPAGPIPPGDGTFPFRGGTLKIDDVGIVDKTHYSAVEATEGYPNGTSKLCLSCHDGVTAMGTFADGTAIDMTPSTLSGRSSQINLSTSHPISFIYTAEIAGLLGASYIYPGAGSVYLETDSGGVTRVQCTSCHQPHQDTRAGIVGNLPFWRYGTGGNPATDYNPVCLACHTSTPVVADEHNF